MPSRWVAIGLVACLVFASLLYGTTQLFPVRPFATADVAVSATVVRGAVSSPLAQGDELHQGDEIWVGADGRATIAMGGSFVRMAPESDLRLDSLDQNQLVVAQLAGRAYHRASVGATGSYQVITGSIAWTAHGTAFDLDRQATDTGDEVRGLALLDGLDLSGPELSASLGQGDSAVVELNAAGSSEGDPTIEPIEISTLDDPWLLENAQLDMLAGLDMGELALVVSPTPTLAVTSSGPPTGPTAAATATVKPAKGPTARPTAAPTRKPTSRSTPAGPANLGKLTTKSNGDGTYTFTWPRYAGVGFSSYRLMHGPAGSTPTYPTSAYWARLTTRNQTSWTGRIDPGDYAVRLQAVDESKKAAIKAQTGVVRLKVPGPSSTPTPTPTPPVEQSLGLSVVDNHDGTMTFTWDAYSGGFDYAYYKLVYGPKGSSPSYLNGDSYFIANSPGNTSATLTIGDGDFISGEYAVRVQAIGTFNGSDFVFGESAATDITVP
jgi:hypothetical protein